MLYCISALGGVADMASHINLDFLHSQNITVEEAIRIIEHVNHYDVGVVINGVRWATRNVDAPGTFAATPASSGRFFQWNRRQGWVAPAANTFAPGWDISRPTGTVWLTVNDPCPVGWRLPSRAELQSLNNAGSAWATFNGVPGRVYGTAPNQIFLPAAGFIVGTTTAFGFDGRGSLASAGTSGFYWSFTNAGSFGFDGANAVVLHFRSATSSVTDERRVNGFSVRCVAE